MSGAIFLANNESATVSYIYMFDCNKNYHSDFLKLTEMTNTQKIGEILEEVR